MSLFFRHIWRRLWRLWGQDRIRLSTEEAREWVEGEVASPGLPLSGPREVPGPRFEPSPRP